MVETGKLSADRLTRAQLSAYAILALPLAMAALPVYVHVPKLYGDALGMPLALVGALLLAVRLFDAFQDPLLGYLSDRCAGLKYGRRIPIVLGLPFLGAGFIALFHPPAVSGSGLALWLAASLLVVYLGFSMASISYFALGAELSDDYHERTRVTAFRGALGLVGVLIAAAAPALIAGADESRGLAQFSLCFVPILAVAGFITLFYTARPPAIRSAGTRPGLADILRPLRNAQFRNLMIVFVLSGVAGAIPGTLILFFVQDVLARPDLAGGFLALYFVAGAIGMPAWIAASRRMGKKRAWLVGMLIAVAAFVWAYFLGPGDVAAFAAVCVLSGLAYGAELAIPPSMLADVIDREAGSEQRRPDGVYFGLWQMIEKLNLAAAAGVALPLLAAVGYEPGVAQPGGGTLSIIYALLPCAIKLVAAAALWVIPLDKLRFNPSTEAGVT